MKLNPESLLVFAAVARGASVTDAARAWGLSQSAMSSRLQSLENRLDVTLLEREGRRLKLTAAGRALQPYADQLNDSHASLLAQLEALRGSAAAQALRVGSPPYGHHLPARMPLIQHWQQSFSDFDIDISVAWSLPMLEQVRSGALDMAFVLATEAPEGVRSLLLETYGVQVLLRRDDPLADASDEGLACHQLQFRKLLCFSPRLNPSLYGRVLGEISARGGRLHPLPLLQLESVLRELEAPDTVALRCSFMPALNSEKYCSRPLLDAPTFSLYLVAAENGRKTMEPVWEASVSWCESR